MIRQAELQGPELTPIAAASLAEWERARDAGRLDEYDSRFGITSELPVPEWEGHDPEQLTSEEFGEVWDLARHRIASRPAWTPRPRGGPWPHPGITPALRPNRPGRRRPRSG